jgi:excisionase family DNA binding protein
MPIKKSMVNAMINNNQDSEMLSIREVSQLLHFHRNTIRGWSEKGIIKTYRIGPRGDRRYKREDIATILFGGKTEDNRPNTNLSKSQ